MHIDAQRPRLSLSATESGTFSAPVMATMITITLIAEFGTWLHTSRVIEALPRWAIAMWHWYDRARFRYMYLKTEL